jgi:hypothetical protein
MKEYKLKKHIPDIVPPKNLEEVIERIVVIEEKKNTSGSIARRKESQLNLWLSEFDERLKRAEAFIEKLKEIQQDGREEG